MKKLLALMLALLMVFAFCGCGEEAVEENTEVKVLTMGTNAAFPPYEMVDENGAIIGIDAEIAAAIAEKMGMTLEIKDMAFDSLITAVSSGAVDVVLAGMTVTEERMEAVNFSESYATGIQVVIVTEDSEIATIEDLAGKKIGVQTGTTGDIYCSGDYGEEAIARYDNGAIAVQALQNGQVDCVVIPQRHSLKLTKVSRFLKLSTSQKTMLQQSLRKTQSFSRLSMQL